MALPLRLGDSTQFAEYYNSHDKHAPLSAWLRPQLKQIDDDYQGESLLKITMNRMYIKLRGALGRMILALVIAILPSPSLVHAQEHYVKQADKGTALAAAWSPDGSQLAIGGSHGIWLYTPELKPITHFSGNTLEITALAWNPNGKQIASIGHAAEVILWNSTTGKAQTIATKLSDPHEPGSLSYSPDGAQIATANARNDVHIWDTASGTLLQTIDTDGPVFAVSWEPKGTRVAFGGAKTVGAEQVGLLQIWDTATHTVTKTFSSDDFLSLASGNDSTVVQTLQWVANRLVIVFSDTYPITVQGGLIAWDIQADQRSVTDPIIFLTCSDEANGISYSPDASIYAYERLLSCPGSTGHADIVIEAGKVEPFTDYQLGETPVRALAWRYDNRTLAVLSGQGDIFIYDVLSSTGTSPDLKPKAMSADFRQS